MTEETNQKFIARRHEMIDRDLVPRGIIDPRVIAAMSDVPREEFVRPVDREYAYRDGALAIGENQTISQPYVVAWMSQLLDVQPHQDVLEVGTGCGYQTAILCHLARHVYSLERIAELAQSARENLAHLRLGNCTLRVGDGSRGWPEHAPFERILVAAAPAGVPPDLVDQLAPGGRMVLPVGPRGIQQMTLVTKDALGRVTTTRHGNVAFVPLIGGD